MPFMVDAPPILQFPQDWLELERGEVPDPAHPVRIVDAWGRPVRYANPGRMNPKGVDLWSAGENGKDELDPKGKDSDDITNWVKEY